MATSGRQQSTGLKDRLFEEPQRFQFYQAVRLLEGMHAARGGVDGGTHVDSSAPTFGARERGLGAARPPPSGKKMARACPAP